MNKTGFASKLLEVRKAKGLTQEEVADKCSITVRTIQRIESGTVKPRYFTMKSISKALEFDFFETWDISMNDEKKHHRARFNSHHYLSVVLDLFNFKTNAMKKISFLVSTILIIGLFLIAFIPMISAQNESKSYPNSITTQFNDDGTIRNVIVQFSNGLTLDSLFHIREKLKSKGLTINYNRIGFDKNNQLSEIDCDVICNDGYSGGFSSSGLNINNNTIGFMRDYSYNAEIPFCTGYCRENVNSNNFLLALEYKGDYVNIYNIDRCAFQNIGFTLKDGEKQAFQQNGMTDLRRRRMPAKNSNHADFLFVVERVGDKLRISGKEGVEWTELIVDCENECKHLISHRGLETN